MAAAAGTVTCRVAHEGDLEALAHLRWAFRAEDGEVPVDSPEAFRSRYAAAMAPALHDGRMTCWVAEVDGAIVSHMTVVRVPGVPRPSRAHDAWGYLTDAHTVAAWRGQGIGATLLAAVVAWARASDLELLLVSPSERGDAFYRRAGFADAESFLTLTLRDFDAPPAA